MYMSQLEQDTLYAVDVVTRMERLIKERWRVKGYTLLEQIQALREIDVDPTIITMLHYLRRQRNRVVHYPRVVLDDRKKFEQYAKALLPELDRSTSRRDILKGGVNELLRKEFDNLRKSFSLDREIRKTLEEPGFLAP